MKDMEKKGLKEIAHDWRAKLRGLLHVAVVDEGK
jgi:hypothetical protein